MDNRRSPKDLSLASASRGMDLLLYRDEEFDPNFFYHSGVDIDNCFLLVKGAGEKNRKGQKILFTSKMNEALARETFGSKGKGRVLVYERDLKILEKHIRRRRLLVDMSSLSASMAARLGKVARPTPRSDTLAQLRGVTRRAEVDKIRKAAKLTHEILASLDFSAAKTEIGLKSQILMKTLEMDAEPAFEPIVSTDPNTRFPHYSPGTRKLGKMVMVDMGVMYRHYRSDLTRMFFLERSTLLETQYEKLQYICYSIIDSLHEHETGDEVTKYAERLLKKAGFPPMIHSLGHGIGLEVHEAPRLNLRFKDDISAGMTMAIEPAFYLSRYGMRHEETVYFDGKRARIL